MDMEEIKEKVLDEYKRVLREWENTGRFYYRFREYIKQYSKVHWGNLINHRLLCIVIAMSRVGVPITSSTLSWISGKGLKNSHRFLMTLASNKIIEPIGLLEIDGRTTPRLYRLSSGFIDALYTRITDRENNTNEENEDSM